MLAWAIYYASTDPAPTDSSATATQNVDNVGDTTTSPSTQTSVNKTNTFPAIFTQSGSHVCKYETVSPTTRSTDVVYIADGKMRGEFRTSSTNDTTLTMMIYNPNNLYTWEEGKSTGKVTPIRTIADLPSVIPKDLTSGAVIGSGLNSVGWDCRDWIKDPKMLAVPTYVKFQ